MKKYALIGGLGFVGSRLKNTSSYVFEVLDRRDQNEAYIDINIKSTFSGFNKYSGIVLLAAEHKDDVSPASDLS